MESGQERKVKGKRKKVERMLQKERYRQTEVREWKKRSSGRNKEGKRKQRDKGEIEKQWKQNVER